MDRFFTAAGRSASSDVRALERLLDDNKGKIDINASDPEDSTFGRSALGYAAQHGFADVVALLLRRGADIRKFAKDPKQIPLWQAAALGHTDVVKALLAGGAKVNEDMGYDAGCPTALHIAAYYGKSDTVRALMGAGAEAAIKNSNGKTASEVANEQGRRDTVNTIKQFGDSTGLLRS